MNNLIIRELKQEEIKECAELIVSTYVNDNVWLNWTVENTIRDLEIAFDNPKYKEKYFVAELNKEIIGIAGIAESFMTSNAFELCYASVKPEYQRKGIGTALILKRIMYAKQFKEHGFIFVSSRRPCLFDKLGFNRITNTKNGAFCYLEF